MAIVIKEFRPSGHQIFIALRKLPLDKSLYLKDNIFNHIEFNMIKNNNIENNKWEFHA